MTPRGLHFHAGAAGAAAGDHFDPDPDTYVLRLYVTGMTPRSELAISNTKAVCEEFLPGRYDLRVVDLTRHPEFCRSEQIIAAPTLIKELPLPQRRMIGDLSRRDRMLAGLGLDPSA